MDLTIPQFGIRQYDWIISLEVAEHIPKKYEAVYLDNILRHATKRIILKLGCSRTGRNKSSK